MDHFKGNIIWTKAKKLVYHRNKKNILKAIPFKDLAT